MYLEEMSELFAKTVPLLEGLNVPKVLLDLIYQYTPETKYRLLYYEECTNKLTKEEFTLVADDIVRTENQEFFNDLLLSGSVDDFTINQYMMKFMKEKDLTSIKKFLESPWSKAFREHDILLRVCYKGEGGTNFNDLRKEAMELGIWSKMNKKSYIYEIHGFASALYDIVHERA
jgi:hypothetical protein